jgi:hyperosmotically inducible protein
MNNRKFSRTTLIAAGIGVCLAGAAVLSRAAYADDPQPHSDGVGAAISDTAVTAKVKAKFLDDSRLKNAKISVTTTNGAVTLTGSAPTSDGASAAKQLASTVDGVQSVDDQITTPSLADSVAAKTDKAARKTGKYASDSWITTKVKSGLLADSVTKGLDIGVNTSNGVVALSGTVASQDALDHAEDLAKKVKGVKSVDSSGLKIAGG